MSSAGPEVPLRIPQPDEITDREKEDAMGAYFMMFAGLGIGLPLPFINLIASVIYYFVNRRKSRFVAFHSLQSLLEQVPVTVCNAALMTWLIVILFTDMVFPQAFWVFLVFVVVVNLADIVISVIALTRARKGRFYYMPLFGRLAFSVYYGPRARSLDKPVEPNAPPAGFQ
jgi:uncharacterized Tic20 family protein